MRLIARVAIVTSATLILGATANAGNVGSRTSLQALLGAPGTIENFETFAVGAGDATPVFCNTGNTLDSTSTCNGQGPGLVNAGISLHKAPSSSAMNSFQWNGAGYFGSPSREFSFGEQPLIVEFNTAVTAFGLDLRAFSGLGATATIDVLAVDNTTVIGTISGIALGVDGVPVFAGWEDAGGIGGLSLKQSGRPWSPLIDNVEWGKVTSNIPEPGTIGMLLSGLAILIPVWIRHRKSVPTSLAKAAD